MGHLMEWIGFSMFMQPLTWVALAVLVSVLVYTAIHIRLRRPESRLPRVLTILAVFLLLTCCASYFWFFSHLWQ